MSITDISHMLFAVYIDSVYSLHFTGDIIHFQISMLSFAFLFFENKSRHATEKYVAILHGVQMQGSKNQGIKP